MCWLAIGNRPGCQDPIGIGYFSTRWHRATWPKLVIRPCGHSISILAWARWPYIEPGKLAPKVYLDNEQTAFIETVQQQVQVPRS